MCYNILILRHKGRIDMQLDLFAVEKAYSQLSKFGDELEKFKSIDFEIFAPDLDRALAVERKSNAGRPPYNYVMMFKILVYQRTYNLSDREMEYAMLNRLDLMRFLGLELGSDKPDMKTIWHFRNLLTGSGAIDALFDKFNEYLESLGIIKHDASIVDSTFVDAPRQRNTREENAAIKAGEIPEGWEDNPHKAAQKDTDARWAKKNNETHYGYKNHIKVDADSKIIEDYSVTPASVHDSNEFTDFFNEKDKAAYADSAYAGQKLPEHVRSEVCEKGYRNKKLTEEQKANNRRKSRVRCRIEHVFGFMTNSMNGITVRSIGIKRAAFNIALTNLVYNMHRYAFLRRKALA